MALRLNGSTSGYVELNAPAVAGSQSIIIPDDLNNSTWTWDTTGTPLSGPSVSVANIPPTATKVIVNYRDLGIDSAYNWFVRGGTSSGLSTSNYTVKVHLLSGTSISSTYFTSGFYSYGFANTNNAANGTVVLDKMDGNEWVGYSFIEQGLASNASNFMVGSMVLSGTLDRIGLVMAAGNFNAGRVFVHYLEP